MHNCIEYLETCHNLCQLLGQLERPGAKHESPVMLLRSGMGLLSPAVLLLLGGDVSITWDAARHLAGDHIQFPVLSRLEN